MLGLHRIGKRFPNGHEALAGITLRVSPACAMVQLIFRPAAASPKWRLFMIWCAISYSALRPPSGLPPACEALPVTFISTMAMLLVARRTKSCSKPAPSKDSTASYSLPFCVMKAPEPGEPSSSSALISTPSCA